MNSYGDFNGKSCKSPHQDDQRESNRKEPIGYTNQHECIGIFNFNRLNHNDCAYAIALFFVVFFFGWKSEKSRSTNVSARHGTYTVLCASIYIY